MTQNNRHIRNTSFTPSPAHTALRRTARVMAVIFAHPSFQYFAQDGEMGKNKKSTENQVIFSALRRFAIFDCDPGEARTLDPLIKSQLLYQLSYGVILLSQLQRKGTFIF